MLSVLLVGMGWLEFCGLVCDGEPVLVVHGVSCPVRLLYVRV